MKSYQQFIIERSSLKAEDYEAAIVIGFLMNNNQEIDNPSIHGINERMYKMIINSDDFLEIGRKIAEYVQKYFNLSGNESAQVYGRVQTNLTKFWKSKGATNTTSKTDILIGDKRLSLKMGMAQLMSGGKNESIATFHAALKNTPSLINHPQVEKVENILNEFVTSSLAPGKLRGIIKSGENEIVNNAEKAHKKAMEELNRLFEESNDFKIAFAREAMSGFMKYGQKSNAAAEYMLVSSFDGNSVHIHSVYDDSYCISIADRMNLQARFKTSSRKLKGQKTGEYNFWSVVSLIVNAIQESLHDTNDGILSENFLSEIGSSIKKSLRFVLLYVTRIFRKSLQKIISFFGVDEPEIIHENDIDFS